jgi:DNA-binding GntR family transcriptional regulator
LEVSAHTARKALNHLKDLGIVTDVSGQGKERLYVYQKLIDLLDQGTEPIPLSE